MCLIKPYREQLHNVRQKATEEEESHDALLRDLKKQLRDAEQGKLEAWDSCKQAVSVASSLIMV